MSGNKLVISCLLFNSWDNKILIIQVTKQGESNYFKPSMYQKINKIIGKIFQKTDLNRQTAGSLKNSAYLPSKQ